MVTLDSEELVQFTNTSEEGIYVPSQYLPELTISIVFSDTVDTEPPEASDVDGNDADKVLLKVPVKLPIGEYEALSLNLTSGISTSDKFKIEFDGFVQLKSNEIDALRSVSEESSVTKSTLQLPVITLLFVPETARTSMDAQGDVMSGLLKSVFILVDPSGNVTEKLPLVNVKSVTVCVSLKTRV